jgi:HEAT repeat protein
VAGLATDPSEFVRRNTADALATMTAHAELAVPALTTLMGDESGQVRFDAAYGLAHHGEAAAPATQALVGALEDDNRYVRNHSVEALKRIGTPEATAALFDFLAVSRWCPITSKESTF